MTRPSERDLAATLAVVYECTAARAPVPAQTPAGQVTRMP